MNDSVNYLDIGARIRRQREQIGLTQERLGEACAKLHLCWASAQTPCSLTEWSRKTPSPQRSLPY